MSRFSLLIWGLFHFGDGLVCQIRKLNWLILRLQDCQICHGRNVKVGNKTILLGSSPRFDHIMYNVKMSLVSLVTLNSFRDVQHLVLLFFLPYYFYYFKIKKQDLPTMKSLCIYLLKCCLICNKSSFTKIAVPAVENICIALMTCLQFLNVNWDNALLECKTIFNLNWLIPFLCSSVV